jgi:hypothetical protein
VTSKKVIRCITPITTLAGSLRTEKSADRGLRRRQDAGTGDHSHSLVEEAERRTHGFPALCISTNLGEPEGAPDVLGLVELVGFRQ